MRSVSGGKEKRDGQRQRYYHIFGKIIDVAKESKDLRSSYITFPEGKIDTIILEDTVYT